MPELPEVENAAEKLRDALLGNEISDVKVLHAAQKRSLPAPATRALIGLTAVSVTRRAKLQLVEFDSGHVLEIHFRMNGDWNIGTDRDDPPQHERVRFTLNNGTRVSLVDSRALSVVKLYNPGEFEMPDFGPEPLDDNWTTALFAEALSTRRGPIKPVLLDQKVVSGLGNIYSAEALWESRIDPRTPANSISRARVERLRNAIAAVLKRAPAARYYYKEGTGDGSGDESDRSWRVYDREGLPCPRCGKKIKRITQAGRSTYWCSGCQR